MFFNFNLVSFFTSTLVVLTAIIASIFYFAIRKFWEKLAELSAVDVYEVRKKGG